MSPEVVQNAASRKEKLSPEVAYNDPGRKEKLSPEVTQNAGRKEKLSQKGANDADREEKLSSKVVQKIEKIYLEVLNTWLHDTKQRWNIMYQYQTKLAHLRTELLSLHSEGQISWGLRGISYNISLKQGWNYGKKM